MCECLRRDDGTWHVDECCAEVMDDWHSGKYPDLGVRRVIRRALAEEIIEEMGLGADPDSTDRDIIRKIARGVVYESDALPDAPTTKPSGE